MKSELEEAMTNINLSLADIRLWLEATPDISRKDEIDLRAAVSALRMAYRQISEVCNG